MISFYQLTIQAAHPKMIAPVVDCPDLMVSDMTQEIGFVQVCISLVSMCLIVCVCLFICVCLDPWF